MSNVIIAGLIMGGLVGLPVGWLFAMGLDKWWGKVLSFVICCSIFFSIGAMVGQQHVNDCDTFQQWRMRTVWWRIPHEWRDTGPYGKQNILLHLSRLRRDY